MPSSYYLQINEILQLIIKTNPEKLLDIGVGFGKYGYLSREYLELWDGRDEYRDWKRKIDGIEVFEKYITPVHNFIYDEIFIGNALEVLPTLNEKYDLILLIDVLEHFDYKDGLVILKECEKHGKNIIISVPTDIGSQGDSFGNTYETHKFNWKRKHFEKFTNIFFLPDIDQSLIVYIGENSRNISAFWKYKGVFFWLKGVASRALNFVHLKEPIKRFLRK